MKELIKNIQEHEPLWPTIRSFVRRYPWTVAFLILFVAMSVGFYRVEQIDGEQEADRAERRAEVLEQDKQFCRAIPGAAVAVAQALVNILVAERVSNGDPESEIKELKDLGILYTGEAYRLALEELPDCPKILAVPDPR